MMENGCGWKIDGAERPHGGAWAVDQRLTWLRPFTAPANQGSWQLRPSIEQELVDFHARYERACIED